MKWSTDRRNLSSVKPLARKATQEIARKIKSWYNKFRGEHSFVIVTIRGNWWFDKDYLSKNKGDSDDTPSEMESKKALNTVAVWNL